MSSPLKPSLLPPPRVPQARHARAGQTGAGRGWRCAGPGRPLLAPELPALAGRSPVVRLKCSARPVKSCGPRPDRQVRTKGRRNAGLLGRLAAASV